MATANNSRRGTSLTPNQLAELKKGLKVNIVVGPDDNRYIGLENASVKLLAHFSPTAQKKLVEEQSKILAIPNGSKKVIIWIYKYMQAGEHDVAGQESFEALQPSTLTTIYQHCEFLEYGSLKKRVYNRLKGRFYKALPTVQEIEFYQTSIPELYEYLLHCLLDEMVNPWTRDYGPYSRLAETNKAFGKALGDAMDDVLVSRVKASEAYYQNTKNRYTIWAIKYIKAVLAGTARPKRPVPKSVNKAEQTGNVAPGLFNKTRPDTTPSAHAIQSRKNISATSAQQNLKSRTPFQCYTCGNEGHISRNCNAKSQVSSVPNTVSKFTCYRCGIEGHIASNCTAVVKEANKRPPPVCFECNETGHIARNCTQEKLECNETGHIARNCTQEKLVAGDHNNFSTSSHPGRKPKSKKPFTCFSCGEEGHMARHCTVEESNTGVEFVGAIRSVDTTAGGHRRFRDTQRKR